MRIAFSLGLLGALAATSCTLPRRPAQLPPRTLGYVAVLSGEMPDPISQISRHSWIVANVPGEPGLRRYELQISSADPFGYFGEGEVALHGVVLYTGAALHDVIGCLDRERQNYEVEHPGYFPIPGPNSNTIIDALLRRCRIRVELPATAIGRDYRGPVGVSLTSRGSGVQLESWVVGLKLGLEEGIELHWFDLPFGLHFWPPGITVPVNPGRIGFDTSSYHAASEPRFSRYYAGRREREREHGLVSFWMYSEYVRLTHPELANRLSDIASVGFDARAVYGHELGYAVGFDFDGGVGFPLGFAYAARLYPAGIAWMFSKNTFIGAFAGVGLTGVTSATPAGFELPLELRAEVDVAPRARVGARARIGWFPTTSAWRGDALVAPFADELVLSAFARIGKSRPCPCPGEFGRGYFFGLERGTLLRSSWLGVAFGVEGDAGL